MRKKKSDGNDNNKNRDHHHNEDNDNNKKNTKGPSGWDPLGRARLITKRALFDEDITEKKKRQTRKKIQR